MRVTVRSSARRYLRWGRVHLTESVTPLGWEMTQRHVDRGGEGGEDVMIVERRYTPKMADGSGGDPTSCKEIFERVAVFKPMDE